MPRIKYTQKVSTKLTRAEKQALSVEKWKLIQEIAKINQDAEEVLKSMSTDAVREFRKNLKKTSANISAVASTLKIHLKLPNLKLPALKTTPIDFTKVKKPPRQFTPLDALITNPGLASSIWNNIEATGKINHYINIISDIVHAGRLDTIVNTWFSYYFNDYETDSEGEYVPDYLDGYACLKNFEAIHELLGLGEKDAGSEG